MEAEEEQLEEVERRLRAQEEIYGFRPFLTTVLSKHPDLFLAYSDLAGHLLIGPRHLSTREAELASISASSALGAEHCLDVHIAHARGMGIADEEVFEAIMVGSLMAMTRGMSTAFRKLSEHE